MNMTNGYQGTHVLVTGADGFIGSHLTERLYAEGADVTALSLYNAFDCCGWLDTLPEAVRGRIRIERGDMRDPAFVTRLCEGQRVIFHLAALIAIPHSYHAVQSYVDVNVSGAVNLLEAARAHRPRRVIMTSTSEVYGTARITPIGEDHPLHGQSPYAASKIAADAMTQAYVRSFDLPAIILRPFNTYGPRQSERAVISSTIRQALDPACEAICVGDLAPTRDFLFVADTVEAFLTAGLSDTLAFGEPYNAGSGRSVNIGQLVEEIRRLADTQKPVREESARFRPPASEVRSLHADASRLMKATNWRPQIDLRDGLAKTIAWWRTRLARERQRPTAAYIT